MRRKDREIADRGEINEIIQGSEVCRLGLSVGDSPYVVPVSFGYDGDAVYLHTAREGKKIEHFEANDSVCLEFERNVRVVMDSHSACKWSFLYESVIGYGRIRELVAPEEKEYGMSQIALQYSGKPGPFADDALSKTRVWKISIDSITGKRSG